jgi:signal transduction histidine kinase/CheY-like chemotaxis protein
MPAQVFRREIWSYVVLLLILFALAAVSVSQVLIHLHDLLIDPEREFPAIAALILLLTMGFMFLAGAFGLWTIQFVTEREAQRRLSQLVDAMDHIQDGMVVVDRSGRVTAMNAGARRLTGSSDSASSFADAFPGLPTLALDRILRTEEATEVEESLVCGSAPARILRFRAHPVGSFHVVMVSDITAINLQRQHSLVKARLQLLGELAKGVAHDFTTLMVDISSYASLLERVPPTTPEFVHAVRAIERDAERGNALAQQVLTLASDGTAGTPTDLVLEHARTACEDLGAVLPAAWRVSFSGEGRFQVVALSGFQVEQIVVNLGLLVAEAQPRPGVVSVTLSQPPAGQQGSYAGILLIHGSATLHEVIDRVESNKQATPSPAGVIQSVIRNIVDEAGGRMDAALAADSVPCFRVCLPLGNMATALSGSTLSPQQAKDTAELRVLLACGSRPDVEQRLSQLGAGTNSVKDIVSALAFIEQDTPLDAMVLDHHLLRPETRGLLRAIRKLRPDCAVVVLAESGEEESDIPGGVAFLPRHTTPDAIVAKLLQSRQSA